MIRIAYVIDHLKVGGAQRHLVEVVRGLDRRVYAPEMWTAAEQPGDLAPVFERLGAPVRSFGIRSTMLHTRTLGAVSRVALELRRRDVQVVHGYLFEGNFLAALVGRRARRPVTLVAKRSLDRYGRPDRRAAAWLSNRLADRVLVNATAVRDVVVDHEWCRADKIDLIPNGVELPTRVRSASRAAPDARGDGPLVGMVGRLGWKKGYEHALEAFALLRERFPGLRVDIVGEGDLRSELEGRIGRLGLDDTVQLLGQRSDVPAQLERFDCFALSSVIEGMPNALLEAMAMGLPVVTTSAGGSAEVVEDGVSGLVVPPANPAALAEAVGRILGDRALATRFGEAAERRVRDHYSLEAMLRLMDALYRRELARAGIPVPTPTAGSSPVRHGPEAEAASGGAAPVS
jgi:glycosyltransferase involved in cell wall biosynthesis